MKIAFIANFCWSCQADVYFWLPHLQKPNAILNWDYTKSDCFSSRLWFCLKKKKSWPLISRKKPGSIRFYHVCLYHSLNKVRIVQSLLTNFQIQHSFIQHMCKTGKVIGSESCVGLLTSASLCADCLALIKSLASQVKEKWKNSQAPSLLFSVLHGYYRFPLQKLEDRSHIHFEVWSHSYQSCWCNAKC